MGSYFQDLWRTFPITLGNQYIRGILAGTACASPLELPIVPHRDAIRGVNMFTLFCPSISFTKPKHYRKTPTQTQQTQSASAGAATLWKNSNLSQSWPRVLCIILSLTSHSPSRLPRRSAALKDTLSHKLPEYHARDTMGE